MAITRKNIKSIRNKPQNDREDGIRRNRLYNSHYKYAHKYTGQSGETVMPEMKTKWTGLRAD